MLGYCLYWGQLDIPIKEIPPDIVDKGCKFEREKKEDIEQMSLFK